MAALRIVGGIAFALIGWSGFCLLFGVHPTDDFGIGTAMFAVAGGITLGRRWNYGRSAARTK